MGNNPARPSHHDFHGNSPISWSQGPPGADGFCGDTPGRSLLHSQWFGAGAMRAALGAVAREWAERNEKMGNFQEKCWVYGGWVLRKILIYGEKCWFTVVSPINIYKNSGYTTTNDSSRKVCWGVYKIHQKIVSNQDATKKTMAHWRCPESETTFKSCIFLDSPSSVFSPSESVWLWFGKIQRRFTTCAKVAWK